jgi:hypothetical protein
MRGVRTIYIQYCYLSQCWDAILLYGPQASFIHQQAHTDATDFWSICIVARPCTDGVSVPGDLRNPRVTEQGEEGKDKPFSTTLLTRILALKSSQAHMHGWIAPRAFRSMLWMCGCISD